MGQKVQNLPLHLPKVAHTVDSGDGNLLADDLVVDSGSFIDNDRDISSKRNLTENQTIVIDGAAPESTLREPRVLYRSVDGRSAKTLAKFVEGNPGNFRSYITLTRKYHPQVIRAAIINMLVHTYFPDLDGDLPADVDGELTGKVGRPRKPGAWVTTCCQAYAQYGIPAILRVLLQEHAGSYNEIRQCLESLAREISPKQFWMQWQESLLPNAEEPPVEKLPSLTEDSKIGHNFAMHMGAIFVGNTEITANDVKQVGAKGDLHSLASKVSGKGIKHGYTS